MRGIGGIFFDYLENDWEAAFAFTQDGRPRVSEDLSRTGAAQFRGAVERDRARRAASCGAGATSSSNLLYDRGTIFGLRTGGNVDSILSRCPLW